MTLTLLSSKQFIAQQFHRHISWAHNLTVTGVAPTYLSMQITSAIYRRFFPTIIIECCNLNHFSNGSSNHRPCLENGIGYEGATLRSTKKVLDGCVNLESDMCPIFFFKFCKKNNYCDFSSVFTLVYFFTSLEIYAKKVNYLKAGYHWYYHNTLIYFTLK